MPWTGRAVAAKLDPLMQPERPFLPKFHNQRQQAVAGPIWRPGNGSDCKPRRMHRDGSLEGQTALEGRRLFARPSTDLRKARPCREVSIRLLIADFVHGATQPHLPVEGFPMKQQRRFAS